MKLGRFTLPWVVATSSVAFAALAAPADLLPPGQAFRLTGRLEQGRAILRYRVADGYYLYRDKIRISMDPAAAADGKPALPVGRVKHDEFFGRVETYRGEVVIHVPLRRRPPTDRIVVTATSQGCADAGVCYPPHQETLDLMVGRPEAGPTTPGRSDGKSLLDALGGKP